VIRIQLRGGRIGGLDVDLPDVFVVLENAGLDKFEASWLEFIEATKAQLDAAKK
jgi:transaldolase